MSDTKKKSKKNTSRLSIAAWGILLSGVALAAYFIYGLLIDGHLRGAWGNMSEAQGSVLSSLITVYAALVAGVVGPALLGSKFNNLDDTIADFKTDVDEQVANLTTNMSDAAVEVDNLTQSTKSSLHTLTELLQRNAGISPTYTTEDLAEKDEILRAMQSQAATYAQAALENSNKWGSTKDKFRGKWPSRQNYIELLWEHGVIDEIDYHGFTKIVKSRELVGEDIVTDEVTLNDLQSTLDQLGEKHDYS